MVITGKLSMRDEKDPQIIVNRARPISDFSEKMPEEELKPAAKKLQGTLYLRISSEQDPDYGKVKAILNMFPGQSSVVLYFADTTLRRGTRCDLAESMLKELKNRLGEANVVLK